jgi:hypothetical protein
MIVIVVRSRSPGSRCVFWEVDLFQSFPAQDFFDYPRSVNRRAVVISRRRQPLVMDAVTALAIALMLLGAWKVIALAFALGTP